MGPVPTEPRADDLAAPYPHPCLCCDELTAAKVEIARLADALENEQRRRGNASMAVVIAQERIAELEAERRVARAELAALRAIYEPKLPYYGGSPHHFCPAHKVVYSECLDQHESPTAFVFPARDPAQPNEGE